MTLQILPLEKPFNQSDVFTNLCKHYLPILRAEKEGKAEVLVECYRDIYEPFKKGVELSYQIRKYKRKNGKWIMKKSINVLDCVPDLGKLSDKYFKKDFVCSIRKMNTKQEIINAIEGIYTDIFIEDWYLEDGAIHFAVACKDTVLDTNYEFSIGQLDFSDICINENILIHDYDELEFEIKDGFTYKSFEDFWEHRSSDYSVKDFNTIILKHLLKSPTTFEDEGK